MFQYVLVTSKNSASRLRWRIQKKAKRDSSRLRVVCQISSNPGVESHPWLVHHLTSLSGTLFVESVRAVVTSRDRDQRKGSSYPLQLVVASSSIVSSQTLQTVLVCSSGSRKSRIKHLSCLRMSDVVLAHAAFNSIADVSCRATTRTAAGADLCWRRRPSRSMEVETIQISRPLFLWYSSHCPI